MLIDNQLTLRLLSIKCYKTMKAFPGFTVRCEGHAKGQASDNNDAKKRLSQVRAEAVRAAAVSLGVTNPILCSTYAMGGRNSAREVSQKCTNKSK